MTPRPALITYKSDFFELEDLRLHAPSMRLLPRSFCRRAGLMVVGEVGPGEGRVTLAMANPQDTELAREVVRQLRRPVEVIHLTRYEIDRGLTITLEGVAALGADVTGRVITTPLPPCRDDAGAIELVDEMIVTAVAAGASDLHLERYPHDVDLRLRVDGLLRQVFTPITPANVNEVVARVMVLAELDLTERARPQDGRFRVTLDDGKAPRTIDLRVNVAPGPAGLELVIRVLDAQRGLLPLRTLGMSPEHLSAWLRLLRNPGGLLLVTGPTGSGKTTTLYASLGTLVEEGRKIVTAEDPIEYVIDHVNQKQASPQLSFGELLRAAMRQNPDVLLFGELRDVESAHTAIAAAETGHLVLSTLHTADAVGAVARLRGLGVSDLGAAESLLGILAQRLLRRVCVGCARPADPSGAQRALFGPALDGGAFVQGAGCADCGNTGYKGRVGVYELLLVDAGLAALIGQGAAPSAIRAYARRQGQASLVDAALQQAAAGTTTLDEVERVLPYRQILANRGEA